MDIRTGQTYESLDAALEAGVPRSDIAEIHGAEVRFSSGPFKDRVYRRINGQMVRVKGGRGWIEKNDGTGRPIKVRA